jgi:hypothetical protein
MAALRHALPHSGPARLSEPVRNDDRENDHRENDHQEAPPEARSALEIIHAQYHRAMRRAARGDSAERASAFAEARRLLGVAVALRGRTSARDAEASAAAVPAGRQETPSPEP